MLKRIQDRLAILFANWFKDLVVWFEAPNVRYFSLRPIR